MFSRLINIHCYKKSIFKQKIALYNNKWIFIQEVYVKNMREQKRSINECLLSK